MGETWVQESYIQPCPDNWQDLLFDALKLLGTPTTQLIMGGIRLSYDFNRNAVQHRRKSRNRSGDAPMV